MNISSHNLKERARNYIATLPLAIDGRGGHKTTYRVACALAQDFGLSHDDAWTLLQEYNERCQPPWSEKELEHKLDDAEKADPPKRGKGWRAKATKLTQKYTPAPPIPEDQQFAIFMGACFQPDEIVSIVPGTASDGGSKAVPEHSGVNVLTRDQLIEKAHKKGGIAKVFSGTDGLFIRINPTTKGSKGTDADVTAYRHTLIESDNMPMEDQERILRESGLPIRALIHSASKSIHALIDVSAKDTSEYHRNREMIWNFLQKRGFEIDTQNKNPSRFTRCPGGLRGDKVQRLIEVNVGLKSYEDWEKLFGDECKAEPRSGANYFADKSRNGNSANSTNSSHPPLSKAIIPEDSILTDYLNYAHDYSESEDATIIGSILPVCGALIARRVYFPFAGKKYPNVYVVIWAPPGMRKSTTISLAEKIARALLPVNAFTSSVTLLLPISIHLFWEFEDLDVDGE